MDSLEDDYWNVDVFFNNAEKNIANVENTIAEFNFKTDKIMICGRGAINHPNFHPRFSTISTDLESELYVLVDHTYYKKNYTYRKGNYAISLIVHPLVVQRINNVGGKIFWFSPNYLDNNLPKITAGKFPKENSGLASISLASYFNVKNILLSGINLTTPIYEQFLEGKNVVFSDIYKKGIKIFSLEGIIAEKISFESWSSL